METKVELKAQVDLLKKDNKRLAEKKSQKVKYSKVVFFKDKHPITAGDRNLQMGQIIEQLPSKYGESVKFKIKRVYPTPITEVILSVKDIMNFDKVDAWYQVELLTLNHKIGVLEFEVDDLHERHAVQGIEIDRLQTLLEQEGIDYVEEA